MKKYDTLVLSGGGLKGFSLLGALQYIIDEDKDHLIYLKKYYGVSVGAIICLLLIMKYQPKDILAEFISNQSLSDVNINIYNGLFGKGFINFDQLTSIFSKMVLSKLKRIPTLGDLCQEFDCQFKCISYNFTTKSESIISNTTHPDMNLLDCIRITSNIPFIFDSFQYNENLYYDGFLSCNFPIHLIDQENDKVIALNIKTKRNKEDDHSSLSKWSLFWDIIMIPMIELQKLKTKEYRQHADVYEIIGGDFFGIDTLSNGYSSILDMYSHGYTSLKKTRMEAKESNLKKKITT